MVFGWLLKGVARLAFEWPVMLALGDWAKLLVAGCSLLLSVGCSKEDISIFEIPHQREQPLDLTNSEFQSHPVLTGPKMPASLSWQAPPGWRPVLPSATQEAAFEIGPEADGRRVAVTIVRLTGQGGTDLANLNRWRAQIGLPPIKPDQLQRHRLELEAGPLRITVYDAALEEEMGEVSIQIVAGIVRLEQESWFFKCMGPVDLVKRHKEEFLSFLRSIKLTKASGSGSVDAAKGSVQSGNDEAFP